MIPGAAVLCFDQQNGSLLQYRQDNQQRGLIGGSMEVGESLEETARREAWGETDSELNELKWFDLFSGPGLIYEYPSGDVVVNAIAAYIARWFKGQLKSNEQEADGIRFFPLQNLPKKLGPPDRPVIERYLSGPS
jgi:8-oxo-dGTP pyrophosphatase MutT (NUDIX family)